MGGRGKVAEEVQIISALCADVLLLHLSSLS